MTSARALKFSEELFRDLCRGRNKHFWEVVACDAKANDVRIVDAIATALDAYERAAWVAITDDPATWPPFGKQVLVSPGGSFVYPTVLCSHDMPELIGQWWRPMVEGPGLEKETSNG